MARFTEDDMATLKDILSWLPKLQEKKRQRLESMFVFLLSQNPTELEASEYAEAIVEIVAKGAGIRPKGQTAEF